MRKYLVKLLNILSYLPFIGKTFRTFYAAAALGASSRAIDRKNYNHAYHVVQRFEKDDIDDGYLSHCQYILGCLLFHGLGTEKNIQKAIIVFERAVSNGSSDAIDYMKWRAERLRAGESNENIPPKL